MKPSKPRPLTRYLIATRRHKALLLFPAIVLALASFLALKQVPDQYESSALIAIEAKSERLPLDVRKVVAIHQQIAEAEFLEDLIAKHNLYSGEIENGAPTNRLIERARRSLNVSAKGGSDSAVVISFRAADATVARNMTTSLAESLVSAGAPSEKPRGSMDVEALQKRAMELLAELNALESKNPKLADADSISSGPQSAPQPRVAQPSSDWVRAQQMTIESLKDQQYKIQQQLADVEQRLETQHRLVEQQKGGSNLSANPTYAVLISRRAELQGQRDTLINRQELTDKHPRVTSIVDQINAIDRQIEELRRQSAGSAAQTPEARELASLETDRNRLRLELEINNREIARRASSALPVAASSAPSTIARPTRTPTSLALARQHAAVKRNYEEVITRIREAESTANAPAGESYRLLEPASLPSGPVSPRRPLITAAAFGAGLVLGACFILATDRRRFKSLEDPRDVEFYAGAPMLAAIPKSLTDAERKRAKLRANFGFAFAMIIAAAASFALAEVFVFTDLIEFIARM
jgi:capsular polysaccharide biosynthesis protein